MKKIYVNKRDVHILLLLIIAALLVFPVSVAAQTFEICGPEKVTRGGVAIYTPEPNITNPDLTVDGQFGIHIKTHPYLLQLYVTIIQIVQLLIVGTLIVHAIIVLRY